jgi:hypothetical protein
MALTGHPQGPPLLAPGPLAACAVGALRALAALAPGAPLPRDGAALLGERAACSGARRRGRISAGGSCRLLPAADDWIALNLARAEDVAALPAWLETAPRPHESPWQHATRGVRARSARELAERGRWLGLPLAIAVPPVHPAPPWMRSEKLGAPVTPRRGGPRVLDLSGLWAGPLATSLLQACGARVWKLESHARPDGARQGPPAFFDLLNAGKASIALALDSERGREALRDLIANADIVVESARPRALAQLGIDVASELAAHPGLTWVSLTGYGRRDPAPGRVAFGDDAAVAAGLAEATGRDEGAPLFCGDAIADPLTGLHAAVAALAAWLGGGGQLIDLSLRDVVAHALAFAPDRGPRGSVEHTTEGPTVVRGEGWCAAVAAPRARTPAASARPLGADTRRILCELGIAC